MLAALYSTGGKDEKEEIASLVIARGRPSLTRMRNDSWHGGRYTEYRQSREKDSLWRIGRDLNAGVDPLSFLKIPVKSTDAHLIKAEHIRAVVCLSSMREKTLQRLFTPKTFRPIGLLPINVAGRQSKLWDSMARSFL
jgi:hypothetical protein